MSFNFQNEQQLLRLLTLYPDTILECGDLRPEHFSLRHHGEVFRAILSIYDAKKTVSLTSVKIEIGKDWAHDTVMGLAMVKVDGGASVLSESIINAHIGNLAAERARSYASMLDEGKDQIELISELVELLGKIANQKVESRLTTADIVAETVLTTIRNPETGGTAIRTGISKLDQFTGGVQSGLLTIVSGCPSHGKSALMVNMALNMAMSGKYVYMASLEDRSLYVVSRTISRLASVNAENLSKCQNIGFDEIQRIESSVERCKEILARISIDDSTGQSVASIRRTAAMLRNKGVCDVSYVDHLGEISRGRRNKYDAATENAEGLRDIANDLDLPVIAGAQVSRSAVQSGYGDNINHKECIPRSHHLRDSGRIEEVARNIWFCHRPHKWNRNEPETDFWVNVDKATHGKTGIVTLKCKMDNMLITDEETFYDNEQGRF
jgi:replicative DNA helicase